MVKKAIKTKSEIGADSDSGAEWDYMRAFQGLVGELFRLNTLYLGTADRHVQALDATTSEWRVLASLQFGDAKRVPQIARYVGISRQAARQTVQKLESRGYVSLEPNPDHRRSSLVKLTTRGKALMDELTSLQYRMTRELTEGLPFDIDTLGKLTTQLEKLRARAEKIAEKY